MGADAGGPVPLPPLDFAGPRSVPGRSDLHSPLHRTQAAGGEEADRIGVGDALLLEDAGGERRGVVPGLHRALPLEDDRAVVVFLVHEVHGAARNRSLRREDRPLGLRCHRTNQGKGAAVATGFDAILAADPPDDDLVIIQDADLEYDPANYPRLMEPLLRGEADAVIGSRWGGDRRRVRGLKRRLHAWANGVLTGLSNLMTGYRLGDMECCYKLLTVGLLRQVRPRLSEPRYGVEPQMVAVLARLGASIREVTVSYDPRSAAEGKKIGWTDGIRALYVIARERFRPLPEQRR